MDSNVSIALSVEVESQNWAMFLVIYIYRCLGVFILSNLRWAHKILIQETVVFLDPSFYRRCFPQRTLLTLSSVSSHVILKTVLSAKRVKSLRRTQHSYIDPIKRMC